MEQGIPNDSRVFGRRSVHGLPRRPVLPDRVPLAVAAGRLPPPENITLRSFPAFWVSPPRNWNAFRAEVEWA